LAAEQVNKVQEGIAAEVLAREVDIYLGLILNSIDFG